MSTLNSYVANTKGQTEKRAVFPEKSINQCLLLCVPDVRSMAMTCFALDVDRLAKLTLKEHSGKKLIHCAECKAPGGGA